MCRPSCGRRSRPRRSERDELVADLQKQLTDATANRETVFKGETLRGLLLTSYGFSEFGAKAAQAATVAYIGTGVMLLLALFGLLHARADPQDHHLRRPRTGRPAPDQGDRRRVTTIKSLGLRAPATPAGAPPWLSKTGGTSPSRRPRSDRPGHRSLGGRARPRGRVQRTHRDHLQLQRGPDGYGDGPADHVAHWALLAAARGPAGVTRRPDLALLAWRVRPHLVRSRSHRWRRGRTSSGCWTHRWSR